MNWAWLRRQGGFSLIEMLVAMALTVIISVAITGVYTSVRLAQGSDLSRFARIGALRNAAQLIANDLRDATQVATTTDCSVSTDPTVTITPPTGGLITYQVSGTNLQRSIAGGNSVTVAYPVQSLAVCVLGSAAFPTYRFTLNDSPYSVTTTIAARMMPNGQGATME